MGIISALLCFLLIAYYSLRNSNRIKSQDEYLLAGRHTKLLPLVATLVMTEFNTGTLISFSSLGYLAGYWALAMPFIFLIGLLFYTLTVAKKWKQFNGVSVAHFFATRYGRKLELLVAIVLFLAMLGFSAAYIQIPNSANATTNSDQFFNPKCSASNSHFIVNSTWRTKLDHCTRCLIVYFCYNFLSTFSIF